MRSWIKTAAVVMAEILVLIPIILLVTRPQQGTSNNDNREITLVDEDDPLGVYEKPLKATVGQMVSAPKYVNGEKASDNVIYDAYRELLNIDFEAQFSANIQRKSKT